MKKWFKLSIVIVVVAAVSTISYSFLQTEESDDIFVSPTIGDFELTVTCTGEIQAKNSIKIKGPKEVMNFGIYNMTIQKMIPEGTVVKKGDFVAELDKSALMKKIQETELNIQQQESKFLENQLDSALNLSGARDEVQNLKFSLEEKMLQKEQSRYEPPAIIRQAEMDYDKTMRNYNRSIENYGTKVQKAITELSIANTDLTKEKRKMDNIMELFSQFTVYAPADGMVIYRKDRRGRRTKEGGEISAWYPIVAELPDLKNLESITYVNEIDIRKVKKGQQVNIGLDAIPDKKLKGEVINVANIGEQLEGSDSKVFETLIKIIDSDSTLLPAMTTSNEILIAREENVMQIPLECLHAEEEASFVYLLRNGDFIKQEVETGLINENNVVIKNGILKSDKLYLTLPEEKKDAKISKLKDSPDEKN